MFTLVMVKIAILTVGAFVNHFIKRHYLICTAPAGPTPLTSIREGLVVVLLMEFWLGACVELSGLLSNIF